MNVSLQKFMLPLGIVSGLGLSYLLFGSNNPTIDAWGYAASVKHGGELFSPHHLLYNATGYGLQQFLKGLGWAGNTLRLLQLMNSLLALGCLGLLYLILHSLQIEQKEAWTWVAWVGASFAVMRFATTNETYLWPILWSLGASWCAMKREPASSFRWLFLAGLCAAMAILYHQLHLGWWLGLAWGIWRLHGMKGLWRYSLPAIWIPVGYGLAFFSTHSATNSSTFTQFVLLDFYEGSASVGISPFSLVLTGINLIRSFVQVHGTVWQQLSEMPWLWCLPLLLLGWGISLGISRPWQRPPSADYWQERWRRIFTLIALIHLGLAFLSAGNAEFMVMLPFLVPIVISRWIRLRGWAVGVGAFVLLIWNIIFGVWPQHTKDYYQHGQLVEFIRQKPQAGYLLRDKNEIENRLYFETGLSQGFNLYPAHRYWDRVHALDSLGALHPALMTDDLDKPLPTSRASLLQKEREDKIGDTYQVMAIDTLEGWIGTYHLYQLTKSN